MNKDIILMIDSTHVKKIHYTLFIGSTSENLFQFSMLDL